MNKVSLNVLACIKKEMAVFKGSNDYPKMFKKLHCAIKSLPKSSVEEAKKWFSAAGNFIIKLRTSLSDKMIYTLCFLRSNLKV